ncbi:hypothetical protein RchiOBHm_Chr4g0418711 [Rosa chinensis]|uniref:Secreted protein n=1 Tax=Rosa chinensis TaxID=74649 RepID=A0A2P6QXN4_ROSCH|nr:hypothetical protein RchiOBHm_Chr4g0418711 [Rosa chinensis]
MFLFFIFFSLFFVFCLSISLPSFSLFSSTSIFITSSIVQSLHKRMPANQGALPVSQASGLDQASGLRRRLSSLFLKFQPISSPATTWALQRSKSVSSKGEYAAIKRWWDWG